MNKIMPYVLVAILLGAVTMVVPYMLLSSSDNASLTEGGTLIQPSAEQPTETDQGRAFSEEKDTESPPSSQTENPTAEEPAESQGSTFDKTGLITESLSNLPSVVLIVIPSFLIALGAFIYLKKRSP